MRIVRAWAVRLGKWLVRWGETPSPALADAVRFARWAEGFAPGTSGEFKRHQVIAKIKDAYPDLPLREISRLIEDAVERI